MEKFVVDQLLGQYNLKSKKINMKISEVFEENVVSESAPKKTCSKNDKTATDNNYTPGKAMLDKEYSETEVFTGTDIPYKQKKLADPRN